MKRNIKNYLFKLGIFPLFDLVRRLPDIVQWIWAGCSGVAPAPIKRLVISAYCRRYGLSRFIETGTHLGDTLAYMAGNKKFNTTSIEIDEPCYRAATQRFKGYSNVTLMLGDSGKLMPELIQKLEQPALFWLDGHYSGGKTKRGELDTPISVELEAVLSSPVKGHVILIDDARCFDGTNDYPHLSQLLDRVLSGNEHFMEVSSDIIRIVPKALLKKNR